MVSLRSSPDGGWGFVIMVATSICFFLSAGMSRCAGVLYTSWKHEFEASSSVTGALASIVIACAHFTCPIGAVVCTRLGVRITMCLGGFMTALGLFLTYWGQTILHMYVFCTISGIGTGLGIVSGLVAVADNFKKYYKAANGFASAGIGIGLVAFPPLLQYLINSYGWRGTMLITAAITSNMCVGGALFRPVKRPLSPKNGEGRLSESPVEKGFAMLSPTEESCDGVNQSASFKEEVIHSDFSRPNVRKGQRHCACPAFLSRVSVYLNLGLFLNFRFSFFCWINLLATVPYICYIIFIIPRTSDAGVSDEAASLVLSALGIASIFGRLASGVLTNWKFSAVKVFAVALLCCCGGTLLALFEDYGCFVASSGIMGFCTGVTQTTTVVVVRKYVGNDKIGPAMGLCYFINGIGDVIGPALSGGIYDLTASYHVVFIFLAGCFFIGFVKMMCLAYIHKCPFKCLKLATYHDVIP